MFNIFCIKFHYLSTLCTFWQHWRLISRVDKFDVMLEGSSSFKALKIEKQEVRMSIEYTIIIIVDHKISWWLIHSHIQSIQKDGHQCGLAGCVSSGFVLLTAPKQEITASITCYTNWLNKFSSNKIICIYLFTLGTLVRISFWLV